MKNPKQIATVHRVNGYIDEDGEPMGKIELIGDCPIFIADKFILAVAESMEDYEGQLIIACDYEGTIVAQTKIANTTTEQLRWNDATECLYSMTPIVRRGTLQKRFTKMPPKPLYSLKGYRRLR
jgi:hypothetical protein